MSRSEIQRRRNGDPSKGTPPDPDFPKSYLIGPQMRVTAFVDAQRYAETLKQRAEKRLPVPGRHSRGRPRKNRTNSSTKGECGSGASG
jgi:hypothetical protein